MRDVVKKIKTAKLTKDWYIKWTSSAIILLAMSLRSTGKFPLLKNLGVIPKDINSVFKYWIRYRTYGQFNK